VDAVSPRTDYATLVAAMRENHHDLLPVVDADRRVMGLVTASYLLAKLALLSLPPRGMRFEPRQVRALRRKGDGVVASELMTTPAWTVTAGTSAAQAAWVAVRHRIHHLPVTDDQHRLVGMVCHLLGEHTGADIASAFGLAEPAVLRQLHHTLRMLSAPCEDTESWAQPPRRIRAHRSAAVGAVRRGGGQVVLAAVSAGVADPGEGGTSG
jgi:CBS-domain-containing membrane protein